MPDPVTESAPDCEALAAMCRAVDRLPWPKRAAASLAVAGKLEEAMKRLPEGSEEWRDLLIMEGETLGATLQAGLQDDGFRTFVRQVCAGTEGVYLLLLHSLDEWEAEYGPEPTPDEPQPCAFDRTMPDHLARVRMLLADGTEAG